MINRHIVVCPNSDSVFKYDQLDNMLKEGWIVKHVTPVQGRTWNGGSSDGTTQLHYILEREKEVEEC